MIDYLLDFLRNNQFASGGLMMGIGAILYRHGSSMLCTVRDFFWRRIFITVKMDRWTYGFEWVRCWLGDALEDSEKIIHEYEIRAHVGSSKSDITLNQSDGKWLIAPDGFRVFVNMHRVEEQTDHGTRVYNKMTLTTGRWNKKKLVALMSHVGEDYGQKRAGKIYMPDKDGTDWIEWCDIPETSMDHIILSSNIKENLLDDLDVFLDSEERYRELGLSYKRGYLLYGPPGNGKTSLIRALANHLGKSIAFVKGSSLAGGSVQQLIARTGSDKLIVVEDIDRSAVVNEEDKEANDLGSRMAGNVLQDILNLLDGVQGGNGQILITTANHPEKLDKAFMRPGRIDCKIELENADSEQSRLMFVKFFGEHGADDFASGIVPGEKSMAEVQQILLEKQKN